jgi:hypothetical protein
MRIKFQIFLLPVLGLIILYLLVKCQSTTEEEKISSMLRTFYTNYITEISETSDAKKEISYLDSLTHIYCTSSLLEKIKNEELDYDPFINAQDADIEWLKTLTINKDADVNNLYVVSYLETYSFQQIKIKLLIVKQKNCYKIDSFL